MKDHWTNLQVAINNLVLVIQRELQIERIVKWLARILAALPEHLRAGEIED